MSPQNLRVAAATEYLLKERNGPWTRFDWEMHLRTLEICVAEVERHLQNSLPKWRDKLKEAKKSRPKFKWPDLRSLVGWVALKVSPELQDKVILKQLEADGRGFRISPEKLSQVDNLIAASWAGVSQN